MGTSSEREKFLERRILEIEEKFRLIQESLSVSSSSKGKGRGKKSKSASRSNDDIDIQEEVISRFYTDILIIINIKINSY